MARRGYHRGRTTAASNHGSFAARQRSAPDHYLSEGPYLGSPLAHPGHYNRGMGRGMTRGMGRYGPGREGYMLRAEGRRAWRTLGAIGATTIGAGAAGAAGIGALPQFYGAVGVAGSLLVVVGIFAARRINRWSKEPVEPHRSSRVADPSTGRYGGPGAGYGAGYGGDPGSPVNRAPGPAPLVEPTPAEPSSEPSTVEAQPQPEPQPEAGPQAGTVSAPTQPGYAPGGASSLGQQGGPYRFGA